MMQSLLPDEAKFIGASWTTLRTTESCLLTTESRLTISGSGGENWVLSATASRFSRPGTLLNETSAVGVRGIGPSQKLVKFEQGNPAETSTVSLDNPAQVLELITVPKNEAVVVLYEDGSCEVRSFENLELVSKRLEAASGASEETGKTGKKKTTKAVPYSRVIHAHFFSQRSCIVGITSIGQVFIIRLIERGEATSGSERFTLEKDQVTLPQNELRVSNAIVHPFRPDSFAVSIFDEEGLYQSFSVSFEAFKPEALVQPTSDKLQFLEGDCLEGTVGSRLLKFNSRSMRLEAWDFVCGVLLEVWPVTGIEEHGCTFLCASPSGRTVLLGNDKSVQAIQINCSDEPNTLARVFQALSKFPPQSNDDEDEVDKTKRSAKKSKKRDVEALIREEVKQPRMMLDKLKQLQVEAFREKSYDLLLQLLDDGIVTSVRDMDDCLVVGLQDGRVDFVAKTLEKCPDVAPVQIVKLIRFLLIIAAQGIEHESKSAIKALTELGGKKLDKGVAILLGQALTCPNVIEKELVEAMTSELRHPEEVCAIVSSLMVVAERSESRDGFLKALFSAAMALDARPLVKIPVGAVPALESLRKLVQRELTYCERSEQALHRMHMLLHDPAAFKQQQQQQRNAGEYRTEVIDL